MLVNCSYLGLNLGPLFNETEVLILLVLVAGIEPSTFFNKLIVHPVAPIVGQLVAFSKFDR